MTQFKWLVAKVSGHVKFQNMNRPSAQGSTVKPSGRFPSFLDNEIWFQHKRDNGWRLSSLDEFVDGVVSHIMSTSGLATGEAMNTRTADLPTDQIHVWCTQYGTEVALGSELLSSLVPTDEQGMAFRKSLEWGAAIEITRACPAWFVQQTAPRHNSGLQSANPIPSEPLPW